MKLYELRKCVREREQRARARGRGFALVNCWYEGDSYFVVDSLVATSAAQEPLVRLARLKGAHEVFKPDEPVSDDGHFDDGRIRFAIRRLVEGPTPAVFVIQHPPEQVLDRVKPRPSE